MGKTYDKFMKFGKGFLMIMVILAIVVGAVYVVNPKLFKQNVVDGSETDGTGTIPTTSATPCPIAPSVTYSITDALNGGTAVTPTSYYRNNGAYSGTTAPTFSGTTDILLTSANYLNKVHSNVPLTCGANQIVDNMYAVANASLTYYTDNGLASLSITQNETVKSVGSAYNWKVKMTGTDKKSTGKQLMVVELSVKQNVSSVTLSGNGVQAIAVPQGYSGQISNGFVAAFLVPAINGAYPVEYNLNVQSASGKTVVGNVYTTIYNVQPFVETDGTFSDSGLAFDSLSTAKYATTQTKNFIIA